MRIWNCETATHRLPLQEPFAIPSSPPHFPEKHRPISMQSLGPISNKFPKLRPRPPSCQFLLKILKARRFLHLTPHCAHCEKSANRLEQGESLCAIHSHPTPFTFTPHDWNTLLTLTDANHFSTLRNLSISQELLTQITQYFYHLHQGSPYNNSSAPTYTLR